MPGAKSGFSLLEVLIALVVVTIGVLGYAGTLAPMARLGGEGRFHTRAAIILTSRLDQLRQRIAEEGAGCSGGTSGLTQHPDGIRESWTVIPDAGLALVRVEAAMYRWGRFRADSIETMVPCP
jgi:prepilin-type N-terminal cleavage/methylation domain-containing protein